MSKIKYPQINLRSKNEIAKRISSKLLPHGKALVLINHVLDDFDNCWYDSKKSEPEKGKYVRSAAKSKELKLLLKLINSRILQPHDYLVPRFIFGGVSGRNNIQAANSLLGEKRNRILLKMDIKSFFEQVKRERVFYFFYKHAHCSVEASNILADICCVPIGQKGSGSNILTLARGFSTSSRLAVWTNISIFQHMFWRVSKVLKKSDPKIAIYVDDIGITASQINEDKMKEVRDIATSIVEGYDSNQSLPVHRGGHKSLVVKFSDGAEHLGLKLGRNKLSLGRKSRSKVDKVKEMIRNEGDPVTKKELIKRYSAHMRYKRQVKLINK